MLKYSQRLLGHFVKLAPFMMIATLASSPQIFANGASGAKVVDRTSASTVVSTPDLVSPVSQSPAWYLHTNVLAPARFDGPSWSPRRHGTQAWSRVRDSGSAAPAWKRRFYLHDYHWLP